MDRRGVLKSVMSTVGGAGLIAASGGAVVAEEQTSRGSPTKGRPVAFIESRDGVGLFYRDWGTGSPLVFLAPWAMDSDWWEYQMAYLVGQGLRCIAYDRRGHGRSVEPSSGYDFDTLADDLNDVIERLDLQGVTLVGHSMGCGEVVRYLSRHGAGRIARIAMVAPNLPLVVKTADNPDGVDRRLLGEVRARLSKDCPRQIAVAAPAFFQRAYKSRLRRDDAVVDEHGAQVFVAGVAGPAPHVHRDRLSVRTEQDLVADRDHSW